MAELSRKPKTRANGKLRYTGKFMMFARMNDWYAPIVMSSPIEKFGASIVEYVIENARDNNM